MYDEWIVPVMVGVILGDAVGRLIWGIAGITVGL